MNQYVVWINYFIPETKFIILISHFQPHFLIHANPNKAVSYPTCVYVQTYIHTYILHKLWAGPRFWLLKNIVKMINKMTLKKQ